MMDAIAAYIADGRKRGLKEASLETLEYRLQALHGNLWHVSDLTPRKAARLYDARRAATRRGNVTIASDTHRNELAAAKTFGAWLAKRGWTPRNPWEPVEPMGGRSRGKEQLRIDEARLFSATCFEHAEKGDVSAVAALMALLLGLRAHEILERVGRDVDDGGSVLWVPKSKTAAGRRRVLVPLELMPHLNALDRSPFLSLWPEGVTNDWLRYHVARLCTAAGVPVVCPHSLRGLHATLAIAAGETSAAVASALGHTSANVTRAHYTQADATSGDRAERALRVLRGGRS